MSYSEENGQVILTMSKKDYQQLVSCLRYVPHVKALEFMDCLHDGDSCATKNDPKNNSESYEATK